eukprot:1735723-Pleurochrysis_carterae.AAC.2
MGESARKWLRIAAEDEAEIDVKERAQRVETHKRGGGDPNLVLRALGLGKAEGLSYAERKQRDVYRILVAFCAHERRCRSELGDACLTTFQTGSKQHSQSMRLSRCRSPTPITYMATQYPAQLFTNVSKTYTHAAGGPHGVRCYHARSRLGQLTCQRARYKLWAKRHGVDVSPFGHAGRTLGPRPPKGKHGKTQDRPCGVANRHAAVGQRVRGQAKERNTL